MAKVGELKRTVQYYRLVDAVSNEPVAEVDWQAFLGSIHGTPIKKTFDRKDLTGNARALSVPELAVPLIVPDDLTDLKPHLDPENTYGLVVSTPKDHVPTQGHVANGEHKPMGLDDEYEPINTLFVWFLPYGNIFGLMQESMSAANARYFAGWLTSVFRDEGRLNDQPDFSWNAVPVIDDDRKDAIKRAGSFKSLVLAGQSGSTLTNPVFDLFFGGHRPQGAYRVEVSIKPVFFHNHHYQDDAASLKEWFDANVDGHLSVFERAKAEAVQNLDGDDVPVGEVDLFNHHLTRKRNVVMLDGPVRAFHAPSAIGEIIKAYALDHPILKELRTL